MSNVYSLWNSHAFNARGSKCVLFLSTSLRNKRFSKAKGRQWPRDTIARIAGRILFIGKTLFGFVPNAELLAGLATGPKALAAEREISAVIASSKHVTAYLKDHLSRFIAARIVKRLRFQLGRNLTMAKAQKWKPSKDLIV